MKTVGNRSLAKSPVFYVAILVAVCLAYFSFSAVARAPDSDLATSLQPHTMVDMHTHTTESDGDKTAEEQIASSQALGMRELWITDHDLIRDLDRTHALQATAKQHDVNLGFGVEITVDWAKKEHHLLGYFPDSAWKGKTLSPAMVALQEACAVVKSSRETRNNKMVEFLNTVLGDKVKGAVYFSTPADASRFVALSVSEVAAWAKVNANLAEPSSLGRPHFSKFVKEKCGVRSDLIFGPRAGDGVALITADGSVFWDADKAGKTGQEVEALMHSAVLEKRGIAFEPLPIVEAIRLINNAGGKAVVAHIPTLGADWADKFGPRIADLAAAGLWGIEAFSSEISESSHEAIASFAAANNLQLTGGSDNHGTLKAYARLGDVHRVETVEYPKLSLWTGFGSKQSVSLRGSARRMRRA